VEGRPSVCYFRYLFKMTFYYLSLTLVALVTIPPALLKPRSVDNTILGARLMQWVTRALGITHQIKNR
jgi:hypothetical protein